MLDENLPTFYIKPSSDNPLTSTIYLSQNGSELQPEYTLRRPDPSLPASKNCYAVALYDPYNPEVLFAEVLVRPEWTQPSLSATEIRAQNGVPPAPVPIVPGSFTVQLYNPDQQIVVRQNAGSWNSSTYWEFEMPQNSFRLPSVSALDRSQSDPAASDITPKVAFKWKRDGKLSKDISCYLAGRTTDAKKNKEPDIPVAMFKNGKSLTMYEPNMHRVEVEDAKGLEVVLLLSATVTKDVFFNATKEMFNIGNPTITPSANGIQPRRKNSGPVIAGGSKPSTTAPAVITISVPPSQIHYNQSTSTSNFNLTTSNSRPVPTPPAPDPRIQWEIEAETERLKRLVEAEEKERKQRERADRDEAKRIQKMIEKEDRERQKREAEVEKETERLRKQYGVPPPVLVHPALPTRPGFGGAVGGQSVPLYQTAPHARPVPVVRPLSTPSGIPPQNYGGRPQDYGQQSNNPYLMTSPGMGSGSGSGGVGQRPTQAQMQQGNSPYLQAPGAGAASSSGFFGLGGKKVQKKRSVFF